MTKEQDPYQIRTVEELRAFYDMPADMIVKAKLDFLDDYAIDFIANAPIVCIGSEMDQGVDVSPRGGKAGFVHVIDRKHVAVPDWPGNNKLETITNILTTGGCGLLFLVPGTDLFLRINGRAIITRDPDLLGAMTERGKTPKTAIRVQVMECYFHCGKAIKRSGMWQPESWPDLENRFHVGQMMVDQARLSDLTADEIQEAYEKEVEENLY